MEHVLTEELVDHYGRDVFDLTFARNTLDHSLDPLQCLRQMAAVTKSNGVVLAQHEENEGENEGYKGLHQWNFGFEDGDLLVGDSQTSFSVAEELNGIAEPIRMWDETRPSVRLVFGAFRVN